ncbi:TPA: hypothetical protein EYP66_13140 [Candidatus Poribacteria bacterium]|nr:hypothetical protein [Candidatus Poribacteria bacterium]
MPIYFFDSSALAKRYVAETGSNWVKSICNPVRFAQPQAGAFAGFRPARNVIACSNLTEVEISSCIDLNLVDRAETFDTVVNKLKENILLYIPDKGVITSRRAPLFYQFQYQWILFKTWVLSWFQKQSDDVAIGFRET